MKTIHMLEGRYDEFNEASVLLITQKILNDYHANAEVGGGSIMLQSSDENAIQDLLDSGYIKDVTREKLKNA